MDRDKDIRDKYEKLAEFLNENEVFQDESGELLFSVSDTGRLFLDYEEDPPRWKVYASE